MEYFILILLIVNTTIAYATVFKKNFEETILFTITTYITVLFLTGILGSLNVGFHLILGGNVIALIYNIYAAIKKKLLPKERIFTFGFIVFLLSYALILWMSIGRKSVEWDEFSHWSLIVKNMFSLGNLSLGEGSTVIGKHYLSGTSMFQFFCTKLSGTFNESMLYVGMNLMLVSTIIPMFKNIKSRKSLISYICFGVMFCIPMYFYINIYKTVYVDGILALVFAATLYSYFNDEDKNLTKFKIINLMVNLTLLIFIKDFGLVLAVGSLFIILADNLFVQNKFKFNTLWENSKWLLLTITPALLIKIIWTMILKKNNIVGISTVGILETILKFAKGEILPYQIQTIESYIVALFEVPLTVVCSYSLTFVMSICLAIILAHIIVNSSENKKQMKVMLSMSVIGAFAYAVLLLFVPFLTIFSEYEATRLMSYQRYMNSYILGLIFMELAIIISELSKKDFKFQRFVLIIFAIFMITFPWYHIEHMTVCARANINSTINIRNAYTAFSQSIKNNVKSDEKVYFIATNTKGEEYYVARYEATPIKLNDLQWSISNQAYSEEDIWTVVKSTEQWKKELVDEYEYVYLFKIDEKFIENYGSLFYNGTEQIKDNQLYKINNKENTEAILELVVE